MRKTVFLILSLFPVLNILAQQVDSIIDIRDGQVYGVVKIGQQWWMQENLNIGIQIDGTQDAANNGIIEKYCYDDNTSNCDIYGGLYLWSEMMDYDSSDSQNPGTTQGICPVGWHLPTDDEWTELTDYHGGKTVAGGELKEAGTTHWWDPNTGATNKSNFTALPGGSRDSNGDFDWLSFDASYWSSTESDIYYVWDRELYYSSSSVFRYGGNEGDGFSVRCLRDSSQHSYLTISDSSLNPITTLKFYDDNTQKKMIIINSSAGEEITISSIYTKTPAYSLNKSSSTLSPGDSIHLTISFNPPSKEIYPDTLYISSDDPYNSLIEIPLFGTFPLEVSFTDSSNVSCFGYADGFATITPSLGTPPYHYQWDDPENTADPTVTGLKANIYYHVTVTDNLGWAITDSIMLSEPDKLEINPYYSDTICLNSNVGFIKLNPSGGTSGYSYSWSGGETSQNLSDLPAGQYSVKVTDSNGCPDSMNFIINSFTPFSSEQICIVTIDLLTGKNLIVWEKTPGKGIAYYRIYRENILIGTVAYDDLSIFKDTLADPENRPYLYTLAVVDTCGNESSQSPYHKPLFLQYVSSTEGVNLTWSKYEIEGGGISFNSYSIYRGSDSSTLSPLAEAIPTVVNVYTDNDLMALAKKYFYRVAGILTVPCIPTGAGGKKSDSGPYSHSMSNLEDNRFTVHEGMLHLNKNQFKIIPNPLSESAIIQFHNPERYSYTLYIMDLSGKVCRIVTNIITSGYILKKEGLQEGFYFIELRGPEVYRSKIVIE